MNLLDENSVDEYSTFDKLQNKIPTIDTNCLDLAYLGKREKFITCPLIQNQLTKVWYGKIAFKNDLITRIKVIENNTQLFDYVEHTFFSTVINQQTKKLTISCMSLGFLAPFLVFDKRSFSDEKM